jgi:HSP90 family molecular chaperone
MTIKETQWDWELLNDVKALWLRNAKDVTPEEYDKFYHSFTKVIYMCNVNRFVLMKAFFNL